LQQERQEVLITSEIGSVVNHWYHYWEWVHYRNAVPDRRFNERYFLVVCCV